MKIFIDTGAFISKYLINDQHHALSEKAWLRLSNNKLLTSNFVLDETFTLLARWTNYKFAAEKANLIYSSSAFNILRPNHDDEILALELFKKYADNKVSFTDCISFVLMKGNKLKNVFSFDKHFVQAGFDIYPLT